MSKLRKSARGQVCTFRIPGVCNGNPETTVLCHAPHPDKGMGIKGPDFWAAYGCSACHDEMDGRTWRYFETMSNPPNDYPRDYWRLWHWHSAIRETQTRMFKAGLLKT